MRSAPVSLPFTSVLALLATLQACSTVERASLTPLTPVSTPEVRLTVASGLAELVPADEPALAGDLSGPFVSLSMRVFLVDQDLLDTALTDGPRGLLALHCARDEAGRLERELLDGAEQGRASSFDETVLTLRDGQRGSCSAVREAAYLAAFDVVATQEATLADPRVDVARDGFLLTLDVGFEDRAGPLDLDLALTLSRLDRPFAEQQVDLLGTGAPLTIQVPTGLTRVLTTRTVLPPDQVLVLGGRGLAGEERGLLVLVSAADS